MVDMQMQRSIGLRNRHHNPVVAATDGLYADNFGAHVRQHGRAKRCGDVFADVENADAAEWTSFQIFSLLSKKYLDRMSGCGGYIAALFGRHEKPIGNEQRKLLADVVQCLALRLIPIDCGIERTQDKSSRQSRVHVLP